MEGINSKEGMKYQKRVENDKEMYELIKQADGIMLENKKEFYRTHDRRSR